MLLLAKGYEGQHEDQFVNTCQNKLSVSAAKGKTQCRHSWRESMFGKPSSSHRYAVTGT